MATREGTRTRAAGGPPVLGGAAESRRVGRSPSWHAWGSTAARMMLGAVFAWFGVHELLQPQLWTSFVPVLTPTSPLASTAVLAHGAVLVVLAVALLMGIAPNLAAGVAAALLLEIVVAMAVQGGINNVLLARDFGILGLALAVASQPDQRLVMRR